MKLIVFFVYFPLLLQRKVHKGKQPEKPFLRERFLATLPKRGGAFLLLRQKCFIPTKTCITPRLPNGGAYLGVAGLPTIGTGICVSLGYSLAHRPMGLRIEVILRICVTHPLLHNPSIPSPCLNLKNKSHPVKSALARTLGVSVPKNSDRGEAFSH